MSDINIPSLSKTQSNSANFYSVNFSTSAQDAIGANDNREDLMIFNDSNMPLLISFTGTVSADEYSVKLQAQGYYEAGLSVFTNVVKIMWLDTDGTGSGKALITEFEG